jgi:2,4-dienoyl-CoA reductase-like NADH-dependent reductase (Old Yellow Enzyme family)/thioredoxin reductase
MGDEQHRAPVAPGVRRLFEPIRIGGVEIPNRIVSTTHGTGLGPDRDLRYLQERARGGAGLFGIHSGGGVYGFALGPGPESRAPDWDGKGLSPLSDEGIAFYDASTIAMLRQRAEIVHAEGAACFAQVYHSGSARHGAIAGPLMAPSAVADPYEALVPHPLSEREIDELIWTFAHQIRRIADAGLDAAEIHGAHGYLVNQFLSPYANRRTDRWGGSTENRVRFVQEAIAAARTMVGSDFPIGIRVGVDGDGHGRGITIDELARTCEILAQDVAYISVSGGNYAGFGDGLETAYVSPWYREPAFNREASAAVKAVVDVPVILTGRIADAAVAESLLADGVADMVGMVRALIADPDLPRKAREGRSDQIRMCLGMSECHAIGPHRVPVTCAVNAAAAREAEMELVPTEAPRTVVVVGAGPAGMETARVAALRGHRVFLADARRTLGGTPAILALDPNRRNLRDHVAFFDVELRRLGVELVLGNVVTADELVEFGADVVVIATGGVPMVPEVPGIDGPTVVQALDVLQGAPTLDRVLVVGGFDKHLGPPTIAEMLSDQGKAVEMVSEQFDFAQGVEDGTRFPLRKRLAGKGVTVSMLHRLERVETDGAVVVDTMTSVERRIDDCTVVLACGLLPDERLARELDGRVPEVHVIGDALAPRRMMHATLEGARTAHAL